MVAFRESACRFLSAELRLATLAFLVPYPEYVSLSNGVRVILDAALDAQSLGLDVCIVPSEDSRVLGSSLGEPYQNLRLRSDVPPGSFALILDTISPSRLAECRARCARICHYALAPSGLFGERAYLANRVHLLAGERQAVYSPHVSTQIPSFYLQSRFDDLEELIEQALRSDWDLRAKRRSGQRLRACFYAGKGYLKPLPDPLRARLNRRAALLFTRHQPATKQQLYQQLSSADLMVCYDPMSSLAYEALLLGVPVFMQATWDEPDFLRRFPVRLDGLVFADAEQFLDILDHGYDHQRVVVSYRAALRSNRQTLIDLLHYAFVRDQADVQSADFLNHYWDQRQPFFNALQLPSPASAWAPLRLALPPLNWLDQADDVLNAHAAALRRFLARVLRRLLRWRPSQQP